MLIITVDHEVFGNGSGCLEHCVINPLASMLDVASDAGAPLTLFVEPLEYIAMEKASVHGIYSVKQQLIQAVKSGHDLQLHVHPQWFNSRRNSDGTWSLDMALWRVGDVKQPELRRLMQSAHDWICDLYAESGSGHTRCIAFRAGGWCIQPSEAVLHELSRLGVIIDTSVAPRLRSLHRSEWYDFRTAPKLPYWKISSDVCRENANGKIMEIPIATGCISPLSHLSELKLSKHSGNHGLATFCTGSYGGTGNKWDRIIERFGKLAQIGHVMLDLSTMSAEVLIEITRQWQSKFSSQQDIPLVAIAHTKNFTPRSCKEMTRYLQWIKHSGISSGTFRDWIQKYD